ncbi:MAG: FG-GAP-like repeat-containing protein [Microcoleaceae cyanobacterium MO_207.B10]|nr:FG-GAP-like repeat-containing protein [Microcoleaceae cyanobacterium MO_207.B10]
MAEPNFLQSIINPFGLTAGAYEYNPTFADIDGDGDLDAFVGDYYGNTNFFRNIGTNTTPDFSAEGANPFGLFAAGGAPTFADIDGDGDLDAFIGNSSGDTIFFRNQGNSTTPTLVGEAANPFGLANVPSSATPTFVDIDGDDDLDAFVGDYLGNTNFFRNTGTKTAPDFTAEGTNPFGLSGVAGDAVPTFGDIDGDGDLDALIGDYNGDIKFFRNTGTNTAPDFTAEIGIGNGNALNPFSLFIFGGLATPTLADIDGDGDLDAFIGNYSGGIRFFENDPVVTNQAPILEHEIDDQIISTNNNLSFDTSVYFSDPDPSDILTYSASNLPSGFSIDTNTGIISGSSSSASITPVTVTADDGNGGTISDTFDLIVANNEGTPNPDVIVMSMVNGNAINAKASNDVILGSSVKEKLGGADGDDVIDGDGGNDILTGGKGNDTITGGDGDDRISGGFGNDLLDGGLGSDTLSGSFGDDTFILASGEGTDTIKKFKLGEDKIGLAGGLTYNDLSLSGNSIIETSTNEVLADLPGFDTTTLSSSDFLAF